MENSFQCQCCRRLLPLNPSISNQRFCNRPKCQQTRRNKWRRAKLKNDPDYRANKADAQRRWRQKNPDYQKRYRDEHPEYVLENRRRQKQRHLKNRVSSGADSLIVKRDAIRPENGMISGVYRLIPEDVDKIVKRDAIIVKIDAISGHYNLPP